LRTTAKDFFSLFAPAQNVRLRPMGDAAAWATQSVPRLVRAVRIAEADGFVSKKIPAGRRPAGARELALTLSSVR